MYLQLRVLGALFYECNVDGMECGRALEFMIGKEKRGTWPSMDEVNEEFGKD
jgi:hypothetical protein